MANKCWAVHVLLVIGSQRYGWILTYQFSSVWSCFCFIVLNSFSHTLKDTFSSVLSTLYSYICVWLMSLLPVGKFLYFLVIEKCLVAFYFVLGCSAPSLNLLWYNELFILCCWLFISCLIWSMKRSWCLKYLYL